MSASFAIYPNKKYDLCIFFNFLLYELLLCSNLFKQPKVSIQCLDDTRLRYQKINIKTYVRNINPDGDIIQNGIRHTALTNIVLKFIVRCE